jgi:Fe-S oxidoreductase
LDDCFTTFQEPQAASSAVRVLEAAGYDVELAGICCGRALISKGYLPQAQALARRGIADLLRRTTDGTPILGIEPSCLLTLADEWTELVPGAASRQVASRAKLADVWLAEKVQSGDCSLRFKHQPGRMLLHAHCHQKALVGAAETAAALRLIGGADVQVLDAGCCGMAGIFGYEKEHFDLSMKIAGLQLVPALQTEPAAAIVATGTSCRHQIHDATGRTSLHPMEVLANNLS